MSSAEFGADWKTGNVNSAPRRPGERSKPTIHYPPSTTHYTDGMDEPLTRDYLDLRLDASFSKFRAEIAEFRADIHRSLLILAGFIVAVAGASLAASQALG